MKEVLEAHGLSMDTSLTDELLQEITGCEPGLYYADKKGTWMAA
jgi:hypothetical protein